MSVPVTKTWQEESWIVLPRFLAVDDIYGGVWFDSREEAETYLQSRRDPDGERIVHAEWIKTFQITPIDAPQSSQSDEGGADG